MPSFDIVSEIDMHEAANAVDQANREVATRFDFKGSDAHFEQKEVEIKLHAETEFQLQQMLDILQTKLAKRGIDIACLEIGEVQTALKQARQTVTLRQGIEAEMARKITRFVKDSKLKVQAAIQGDKLRITGKKRDDLQEAIALLRQGKWDMPLQFNNFRD